MKNRTVERLDRVIIKILQKRDIYVQIWLINIFIMKHAKNEFRSQEFTMLRKSGLFLIFGYQVFVYSLLLAVYGKILSCKTFLGCRLKSIIKLFRVDFEKVDK